MLVHWMKLVQLKSEGKYKLIRLQYSMGELISSVFDSGTLLILLVACTQV